MRTVSEHEWAAIGGLFLAGPYTVLRAAKDGLTPDQFTNRALGLAFQVLLDLSETGIIDRVLFKKGLQQQYADYGQGNLAHTFDEVLTQVWNGEWSKSTALFHCGRIRDFALLCDLRDELKTAVNETETFDGSVKDLLADINRRVSSLLIRPSMEAGEFRTIIPAVMEELWTNYDKGPGITGIPTGFKILDETLDGLLPGTLHIVAGRTSSGKSTFVGNIACQVAVRHNRPVVIVSLEMKRKQVGARYVFSEAQVSREDYRKRLITAEQRERMNRAAARLRDSPIRVEDNVSLTLPELLGYLRHMRHLGCCDLAIVDYTQLISMPKTAKRDTRQNEVTEIVKALHSISMELEIPVMALSQLNDEGRARESRDIENYAESFLVVEQKEDRKDPLVAEKEFLSADLVIQKNRDGQVRVVPMLFYPRFTRFVEVDFGEY